MDEPAGALSALSQGLPVVSWAGMFTYLLRPAWPCGGMRTLLHTQDLSYCCYTAGLGVDFPVPVLPHSDSSCACHSGRLHEVAQAHVFRHIPVLPCLGVETAVCVPVRYRHHFDVHARPHNQYIPAPPLGGDSTPISTPPVSQSRHTPMHGGMAHLFGHLLCLSANTWHHKTGSILYFSCVPGLSPGEIFIWAHVPAKS